MLSDTVGFVSNIPHNLIKAFRSTLEEVKKASLLVHVVDYSDENYLKNTSDNRKVIDFIAGMTDDYFEECYLMIKKTI